VSDQNSGALLEAESRYSDVVANCAIATMCLLFAHLFLRNQLSGEEILKGISYPSSSIGSAHIFMNVARWSSDQLL